jgi:hypothetical protein
VNKVELTKEEKITIIDTHLKTIAYSKYNLDLSLIEENAKETPDLDIIARHNENISLLSSQIAALEAEKNNLN